MDGSIVAYQDIASFEKSIEASIQYYSTEIELIISLPFAFYVANIRPSRNRRDQSAGNSFAVIICSTASSNCGRDIFSNCRPYKRPLAICRRENVFVRMFGDLEVIWGVTQFDTYLLDLVHIHLDTWSSLDLRQEFLSYSNWQPNSSPECTCRDAWDWPCEHAISIGKEFAW